MTGKLGMPIEVDSEINLSQIIPLLKEMLNYCAAIALESNEVGSLAYDSLNDEVIYHTPIRDFDRDIFDTLYGVEEIWIVQKGGAES